MTTGVRGYTLDPGFPAYSGAGDPAQRIAQDLASKDPARAQQALLDLARMPLLEMAGVLARLPPELQQMLLQVLGQSLMSSADGFQAPPQAGARGGGAPRSGGGAPRPTGGPAGGGAPQATGGAAPVAPSNIPGGGAGVEQWREKVREYGAQHGISPAEMPHFENFVLAMLKVESGGDPQAIGDNGHSVGLFQMHDRGAGAGLSVEERMNPDVQFAHMMPRFVDAYRSGRAQGLDGAELAVHIAREAERPIASALPKYGAAYDQIVGLA